MQTEISKAYRLGMRRLASSVTIITTAEGPHFHGMAATAVTSVTADPPTLLICVNRTASIYAPLRATRRFCVNVLSEAQATLPAAFSGAGNRHERFTHGTWSRQAGMPVLSEADVSFICDVTEVTEVGSHAVFFGAVQEVIGLDGSALPLIWHDGACKSLDRRA